MVPAATFFLGSFFDHHELIQNSDSQDTFLLDNDALIYTEHNWKFTPWAFAVPLSTTPC